jgi:hypothetical protein
MATEGQLILEAIRSLAQAIASGPSATRAGGYDQGGGYRVKIDTRHAKLEEYSGKKEDWTDWSFSFKKMIKMRCRPAYDRIIEMEDGDFDEDLLGQTDELTQISAELYDILCQVCRGDARTLLMTVDDMNGFQGWQALYRESNSRTVARMIKMLGEVTGPPKVTDMKDIGNAIGQWEKKEKLLKKEYNQEFAENTKIAIVTNMMPASIQEYVYTNIRKDDSYKNMVDKVKLLVSNKVVASGPTPMDLSSIGNDGPGHGNAEHYNGDDGWGWPEEQVVDAVGMHMQCHGCGGWGHLRRECPTTKGKGKGEPKGAGKSHGKGRGKGKGYPGPGKGGGFGKGYQGKCFHWGSRTQEVRMPDAATEERESGG